MADVLRKMPVGFSNVSAPDGVMVKRYRDMGDGTHAEVISATFGGTIGAVTIVDGGDATQGITTGAKVVTDAPGTLQQYLRGLVTFFANALGAGTAAAAHRVTLASDDPLLTQAYSAVVNLTRPADTNTYAANDVIGAATGSTAALTFTWLDVNGNPPPSGSSLVITSAALQINLAAIISGMTSFRLYKYNVTPPSALGDNAAFDLPAGDRAAFLRMGYIDLGSPVDLGSTLYVEQNGINKQVKLAGATSFGYFVTNGAYAPSASDPFVITLHAVKV